MTRRNGRGWAQTRGHGHYNIHGRRRRRAIWRCSVRQWMRLLCGEQNTVWGGGQVALVNLLQEWQATRTPIEPTIACPSNAELALHLRPLQIPLQTFDPGEIDKQRGVGWNFAQRIRPTLRLLSILRRTHAEVVL